MTLIDLLVDPALAPALAGTALAGAGIAGRHVSRRWREDMAALSDVLLPAPAVPMTHGAKRSRGAAPAAREETRP